MEENYATSLKGQFMVAMPDLADPNFYKTVTCICEHVATGAVGIVVNRIHPILSGKDIFQELKMEYLPDAGAIPIYLGGPVHVGEIFVLHGPPFEWAGCLQITSSLAMSNTKEILNEIAMGRGPESYIIVLGCAGWGQGQLDAEIKSNVWLTWPIFNEAIFGIPPEERWYEVLKMGGVDPVLISRTPGHA